MAKIAETKEIDIKDCVIGKAQARSRDVGKDVDELAESISKVGLLQPICVCPSNESEGQYEVLIGQRRLAAHQLLEKKTIMASIFNDYVDELQAKVISLTENMVRTDMTTLDYIDCCTWLYNKYGSFKHVAEKTGLSVARVSKYIKGARLKEGLKELVYSGKVDVKLALKAQDAIEAVGDYDKEKAIALASEMGAMSGPQRTRVIEIVQEGSETEIEAIVEGAKKAEDIFKMTIALLPKQKNALEKYRSEEKTNMVDAAVTLIDEGLTTRGFGDDQD